MCSIGVLHMLSCQTSNQCYKAEQHQASFLNIFTLSTRHNDSSAYTEEVGYVRNSHFVPPPSHHITCCSNRVSMRSKLSEVSDAQKWRQELKRSFLGNFWILCYPHSRGLKRSEKEERKFVSRPSAHQPVRWSNKTRPRGICRQVNGAR